MTKIMIIHYQQIPPYYFTAEGFLNRNVEPDTCIRKTKSLNNCSYERCKNVSAAAISLSLKFQSLSY